MQRSVLRFLSLFVLVLFSVPGFADDLKIKDIRVGEGAEAKPDMDVTVHYTGWLMNGNKFDSSIDRNRPFTFALGDGQVIPGWDLGVKGMREGGKRELIVPPEMAYGSRGAGHAIPPNATLRFEVSLLKVSEPKFTSVSNQEMKELLAKGVTIVDIRTQSEWKETGIIKDSKLITLFDQHGRVNPNFEGEFAATVKKDEPVLLICRSGNRTRIAAKHLSGKLGYSKIYNVRNGIRDWIKEGNDVVKVSLH